MPPVIIVKLPIAETHRVLEYPPPDAVSVMAPGLAPQPLMLTANPKLLKVTQDRPLLPEVNPVLTKALPELSVRVAGAGNLVTVASVRTRNSLVEVGPPHADPLQ